MFCFVLLSFEFVFMVLASLINYMYRVFVDGNLLEAPWRLRVRCWAKERIISVGQTWIQPMYPIHGVFSPSPFECLCGMATVRSCHVQFDSWRRRERERERKKKRNHLMDAHSEWLQILQAYHDIMDERLAVLKGSNDGTNILKNSALQAICHRHCYYHYYHYHFC